MHGAGLFRAPTGGETTDFTEQLRVPALSIGTYSIPAGGADDQTPHREDEVYVVTAGIARLVTDTGEAAVGPGDVIFVPKGEAHTFTDITQDLSLLVLFAPAYTPPPGS